MRGGRNREESTLPVPLGSFQLHALETLGANVKR